MTFPSSRSGAAWCQVDVTSSERYIVFTGTSAAFATVFFRRTVIGADQPKSMIFARGEA
jgi:hypothetical protein